MQLSARKQAAGMPQWAGSGCIILRYLDAAKRKRILVGIEAEQH